MDKLKAMATFVQIAEAGSLSAAARELGAPTGDAIAVIGDGALIGFKAWYDPARNEETELAAGHLLISYKYTPPPPMERLTYETEITSEYLLTLKGGN